MKNAKRTQAARPTRYTVVSVPGSDDGRVATLWFVMDLQAHRQVGGAHDTYEAAEWALMIARRPRLDYRRWAQRAPAPGK